MRGGEDVIQLIERARRHRGAPPIGLTSRCAKEHCMQTRDRVLARRAAGLQLADPRRRFLV
jgi:hypothetical protein